MWRRTPCRFSLLSLHDFINPHKHIDRSHDALLSKFPQLVLSSNASNIHDNLTTEEAIMKSVMLNKGEHLLFVYRNDPCVVVGRNQNVFQEVAMRRATRDKVIVARRTSGGGTVFQDSGNLCFSFITHRADYAPERSIQILRWGLCDLYGIAPERLTTTKRNDLFLDGLKITGSAMRVQRDIAMHHCTLLVNSCKDSLGTYLRPEGDFHSITTTSVGSVRSPVTTLNATCPIAHSVEHVQARLGAYFLSRGGAIMSHEAPWEMDFPHPADNTTLTDEEHVRTHSVTLDVAKAATEGYTFLAGDRRIPTGDCTTFTDEVSRLRSVDWIFAMPKYVTEVTVSLGDLRNCVESHPMWADALLLSSMPEEALWEEILMSLGGSEPFVVRTTVEHRRITHVAVVSGDATASPIAWLSNFLEAVLVGCSCDLPITGLETSTATETEAVLEGLRREATAANVLDFPPEFKDMGLFFLAKAVISTWRRKNVLDYSM